jgi:hypothetical protein
VKTLLPLLFSCFLLACSPLVQGQASPPSWAGKGAYRLLVEVPPLDIGSRQRDLMPTDLPVDLSKQLKALGVDAKADLGSLQVIRYDPATGKPAPADDNWLYGRGPDDRPFRWYDAAIPYEFPQILGSITRANGELHRLAKTRGLIVRALAPIESPPIGCPPTSQSRSRPRPDPRPRVAPRTDRLPPCSKWRRPP